MKQAPTLDPSAITVKDNHPTTTSLIIAKVFNKRHDDILKKISNLECTTDFTARNFAVSEYKDPTGRRRTYYNITKDGFAFIVMGFTGKKAALMKEQYINAFNQMEESLQKPRLSSPKISKVLMVMQDGQVVQSQTVAENSVIVPASGLADLIREGGHVSSSELPGIIKAAADRLLA